MIEVKIERPVMDTVDEKKPVLFGWPSLVQTGVFCKLPSSPGLSSR